MSIQSISTAFIPSPEPSRGKVSVEKVKAVPVEKQVKSSDAHIEKNDVKPEDMARELNKVVQKLGSELSFSVDSELNKVVVTITDLETKEVIRQIPSEEMIALAKRLREMESGGDVKGIIVGVKG